VQLLKDIVPQRPAGFCTGCPERPIFSAMKLTQRELGEHHIACDIGCHLFSIMPPFNIGATTMGYGLGAASASALNVQSIRRSISIMGDGGFWHNGLTSGIGNAVFNQSDDVIMIVDNYYSSSDRRRRARRRGQVGEAHRPNLRRRGDARHAYRCADYQGEGAESHHRIIGVHAEPATARKAAGCKSTERGSTRGSREVWCG
jgi:hypothetical protein